MRVRVSPEAPILCWYNIISILLILITSILLIITGLKKRPGIGIIVSVVIISITLWFRHQNLNAIGFALPSNWGATILLGLIYGSAIFLLSAVLIDPLSEKLTKTSHDYSAFKHIKGNWKAYIQIIAMVWIFVATIEEGLYRGFLMTEFSNIAGTTSSATIINLIFTSVVFGLSHGYQNRCGIVSTGIIGFLFGCVFVFCGFNVWVALFAHGFLDTIALGLIVIGKENYLQQKIWNR